MKTVLVLARAQMGDGDPELGRKLLGTFLRKAVALHDLHGIVFYNDGVRLIGADSPVLAELSLLEERGVDLFPCGTCLKHHGIEPAVGKASDMDTILRELDAAEKVIPI